MRPEALDHLSDILARAGRCVSMCAGEAWAVVRSELAATQSPSTDASDDEGLTVEQAALELNVEKWRVYEMVRRGALPHYRPSSRTIRVRRGDVKRFIRQGKCTTVEEKRGARGKPLRLVKP